MEGQQNIWEEGQRYLLQWDAPGDIITSVGAQLSRIRGEAVLVARGDHEKARGLYLDRFGIAAAGVEAREAHTGTITVRGLSASGIVKLGRQHDEVRIDIVCDINYESLDHAQGREVDKGCYYIPATEPASAVIEGQVVMAGEGPMLVSARIYVSCAAGEFQEVVGIEFLLEEARLIPLPGPEVQYRFTEGGEWAPSQDANIDSNVCVASTRRQLIIQPVAFRSSTTDPSPSGTTAAAQLATAQTIWVKGCIDFTVRPTVTITHATLKTSSNITEIRNAYTDSDPNVIEMFFVQNPLTSVGGGTAGGIGVASCKPVIAEPNGGNPVLVAHELGHVLGLLHPPSVNSDPGTVMAPTGSAMTPGTQLVTHIMCTSIANPVLQTTTTACCFTHNIPNHYLRDFPTDVGNEPSEPIGAGMNRYAMSNVWNRRTNTPGTPSPTTGPEHEQPVRFLADMMTPRINYLFARVEQLNNLPVRNAVVRFFLKHPGSGGGAMNVQLLGEVAVPGGLGVGTPQNVSMAWTVPTATPTHSCIFAVVRSDAEPEGDQSMLDWWQFESLNYNDNDWAQRNLEIENVSSSNTDDTNQYESAPFLIFLPPENQRPSSLLTLEIDATQAHELSALSLEVVNVEKVSLPPGGSESIEIDIREAREPLVVVLHTEIPPGLEKGTRIIVNVNPSIGNRAFVGWATQFHIARARDVLAQTLDDAAAGFGDLVELADLPGVHALFCAVRGDRCERSYSSSVMIERLDKMRRELEQAGQELDQLDEARRTGASDSMHRLLEALDAYTSGQLSAENTLATYRAVCCRAMMAAALLAS